MNLGDFKRTSHLSDSARQEVLDRIESSGGQVPARHSNQRRDPRLPYRQRDIAISVEHPGGGASRLLLFARNLSAGGISFIHNSFLYPGSRCKVFLPRNDGSLCHIQASLVRCRHVYGLFHEIGVRFEVRIDPTDFLSGDACNCETENSAMELPELLGRIAVVESSKAEGALMQHFLKLAGAPSTVLHTSGAALDMLKQKGADIVICELNIAGYDGVEFIRILRELKFAGPILLVSADTNEQRINAALQAGANRVLRKPYDAATLLPLIIEMNEEIGAALPRQAIFSTLDDQGALSDLIAGFVEQSRTTGKAIETAAAGNNPAEIRQLCMGLKGSATGYGFTTLGEMAGRMVEFIDANRPIASLLPRLKTLISLCCRLRVRSKARKAA